MHSELSAELYTAIKDQDVGTLRTILRGSRNHSYRPDVHHMLCVAAELGAAVIIKVIPTDNTNYKSFIHNFSFNFQRHSAHIIYMHM